MVVRRKVMVKKSVFQTQVEFILFTIFISKNNVFEYDKLNRYVTYITNIYDSNKS